jgi:hypothetical protein
MSVPRKLSIFSFNVGFGDCYLLRFTYDNTHKHVLIDFGSTEKPEAAKPKHMVEVAKKIAELCGPDGLDILVATHRHKDHISGFTTSTNGKGSGDIIAALKPRLVLQPWTEDPDIPEDAEGPVAGNHAFRATLRSMQSMAAAVEEYAATLKAMDGDELRALGFTPAERDFLAFVGENNVKNKNAINNLIDMGKATKAGFLHADMPLDVKDLLPGVTVDVLGPPTVEQHGEVATQNPTNQAEYWHLVAVNAQGTEAKEAASEALFPSPVSDPPHGRWAAYRLRKLRKEMLMPIVTALDDAMNNTSLILLFRVGGKSFLFPGDAQWENWQYALSKEKYVKLLKGVNVYKVGHHGSLNATPKSLWALFEKKGDEDKKSRLTSLMSTKHGVHGHSPQTAVPRSTLVTELRTHSHHHSTEDFGDQLFREIPFDL